MCMSAGGEPIMIVKGLFALQRRRSVNDTTYAFFKDPSVPFAAAVKTFGELDQPAPSHPALHLKTLLVPIDFSESSQKTLIYAVRLAQRNNSSLLLLHVFEPPQFVRQLPPDYSFEAYEEMRKLCNTSSRQSEESLVRLSRRPRRQPRDRNFTPHRNAIRRDRQSG